MKCKVTGMEGRATYESDPVAEVRVVCVLVDEVR